MIPQADIQQMIFGKALAMLLAQRQPVPVIWKFPNGKPAVVIMTGDHHGDQDKEVLEEIELVEKYGGSMTIYVMSGTRWRSTDPPGATQETQPDRETILSWRRRRHELAQHLNLFGLREWGTNYLSPLDAEAAITESLRAYPSKVTLLPTNSASGVLLADFNRDGRKDILFACHSKDGNHRNDSFLYWGSSMGYSKDPRSLLPGLGPHLLTVTDIGHIYDRGDRYDYISPPFDAGPDTQFESISWEGKTPFRTGLEFQVRAAASREELASAPWQGPQGPKSFYREPDAKLSGLAKEARWIQYKASLISPDSGNTPILRSVSISLR